MHVVINLLGTQINAHTRWWRSFMVVNVMADHHTTSIYYRSNRTFITCLTSSGLKHVTEFTIPELIISRAILYQTWWQLGCCGGFNGYTHIFSRHAVTDLGCWHVNRCQLEQMLAFCLHCALPMPRPQLLFPASRPWRDVIKRRVACQRAVSAEQFDTVPICSEAMSDVSVFIYLFIR